jgi:hypothetical protein
MREFVLPHLDADQLSEEGLAASGDPGKILLIFQAKRLGKQMFGLSLGSCAWLPLT